MKTVHAIYQNGVFQPVESVEVPKRCEVDFEPRVVSKTGAFTVDAVYAVLSERCDSGHPDTAARHDEHQA